MDKDKVFSAPRINQFWQRCQAEITAVEVREIIWELLCFLDRYGVISSVRSQHAAKGMYRLQGTVSLIDHTLNVAEICLDKRRGIVGDLSVIAALGHDFGKMKIVHQGPYTEIMHTHWGAECVAWLIGGRLIDRQEEAVVSAVRNHHLPGDEPVLQAVRKADKDARVKETNSVAAHLQREA